MYAILALGFYLILNDLIYSFAQIISNKKVFLHYRIFKYPYTSVMNNAREKDEDLFHYMLPIFQIVLGFILINKIEIEGYYKTFQIIKLLIILLSAIKTLLYYHPFNFVADLVRMAIDPILICCFVLICLTDPIFNNEDYPNIFNFTETFLRYIESWSLYIALNIYRGIERVDRDKSNIKFSTFAIIGKYDNVRYTCLLILIHYFFCIINGLAYSFKYFINLFTIPLSLFIFLRLVKGKHENTYYLLVLLFMLNLLLYLWAFLKSFPNEGTGI